MNEEQIRRIVRQEMDDVFKSVVKQRLDAVNKQIEKVGKTLTISTAHKRTIDGAMEVARLLNELREACASEPTVPTMPIHNKGDLMALLNDSWVSINIAGVNTISCDYLVDSELWQVSIIFNERTPLHCGQFGDRDQALAFQKTLINALRINKVEEKAETVAVQGYYAEDGTVDRTHHISPNDVVEVRIDKRRGGGWNVVIDMGTYEILRWHFVTEQRAAKRLADLERARLGIPTGKKGTDGWLNPR